MPIGQLCVRSWKMQNKWTALVGKMSEELIGWNTNHLVFIWSAILICLEAPADTTACMHFLQENLSKKSASLPLGYVLQKSTTLCMWFLVHPVMFILFYLDASDEFKLKRIGATFLITRELYQPYEKSAKTITVTGCISLVERS